MVWVPLGVVTAGPGGQLLREVTGSATRDYIYAGGRLIGWADTTGVFDVTTDAIGSIRMVTNASQTIVERHDYLPFGEEWAPPPSSISPVKFGGKERDAETGFDYFGARYLHGTTGRFTSPDAWIFADPARPQSWNLYVYVLNNPLRFIDPDGHDPCKSDYYDDDGNPTPCFRSSATGGGGGGREDRSGATQAFVDQWARERLQNALESQGGRSEGQTDSGGGQTSLASQNSRPSTLEKLGRCTAAQYGFGDGSTPTGFALGRMLSEVGSLPVFKPLVRLPVIGNASKFTNVLNYTSLVMGLDARFTGLAFEVAKDTFGSVRIATVLGRANVFVGGALLIYDSASIAACTIRN